MNPWTAFLQSVHSALIDELTERHPDPKPELGLPMREESYRIPDPSLSSVLACEVALDSQRGLLLLANEPGFTKALGVTAAGLWQAILSRAGPEFDRRGIKPGLSAPITVLASSSLPSHFPAPGRVIWFPFAIPGGRCFLGVGV